MNPVAVVDWFSLAAGLAGMALLIRGWKSIPSVTLRHTFAVLIALIIFNGFSNSLEWSGITGAFDRFEDYTQLLIPLLWGLAVYELLRRKDEQVLKDTIEQLRQERDLVQSIAQTSPAGIMLLSPAGEITYANRRAEQVLGRDSEELLGGKCNPLEWGIASSDGSLIPQEQLPYRQVAQTRQPLYNARCSILRPDGQRVHLAVNAAPLTGTEDQVQGVVMTFEDITERVQADQALRDSEYKLRSIIDQSIDMIVLTDEAGLIIEWNASAAKTTGLQREDVLNRPIWEVQVQLALPERRAQLDLEFVRRTIQEALDTGQADWLGLLSESTIQRRDGTQRALQSIEFTIQTVRGFRLASVLRDVTDYQQAKAALVQSERNYREIFNAASDAIFIQDVQAGAILDANQTALDLFGYSYGEALRMSIADLGLYEEPEKRAFVEKKLQEVMRGSPQRLEWLTRKKNGRSFWAEVALSSVELGGQRRVLASVRDISARKQAEQALFEEKERAQVTLHSIGDAVITTDAQAWVQYLNPVAEMLTGWTMAEARGCPLAEVFQVVNEQTRQPASDPVERCLRDGKIFGLANHSVLISRSGKEYDIADTAAPMLSADGQVQGVVLVFHDVTEGRRLERQMAHDAAHDTLTGLVNRREFEVRIERALASAKERNAAHVLCYLDLDQFKIVNDTAGHAAGDELLKQVSNLLSGMVRHRDTLARLGGDEFGLLLENCPLESGVTIANEVIAQVHRLPFTWQGRSYQIGVSIGVVPLTAEMEGLAQALSQADVACYTAKDLGRGRLHVYQWQESETAQRHAEILRAAQLRQALERERFRLYCQPIVPLQAQNAPRHYEVLLRLLDEDGQLLHPATFIPSAERYGLMSGIDRWVIQAAFRRYAEYFGGGGGPVVAINLSGNSLNDETLLDFVYTQFRQNDVPPACICFEITETAAIHNLTRAKRFVSEMRRMNGRIALDNFGSGFSSFRYLKNLPVDFLKIEGSFVRDMRENASDRVMVTAINQVGHTLGIQTIAEHVSDAAIAEQLRELGVDYAQGYGLGLPQQISEVWGQIR